MVGEEWVWVTVSGDCAVVVILGGWIIIIRGEKVVVSGEVVVLSGEVVVLSREVVVLSGDEKLWERGDKGQGRG